MSFGERPNGSRPMLQDDLKAEIRHVFERRQLLAGAVPHFVEQFQGVLGRSASDKSRYARLRRRQQFKHRCGDDTEGSLRTDEKIPQVVAGIVLSQAFQPVPDAPVGEHHFQPEGELAGVAIS